MYNIYIFGLVCSFVPEIPLEVHSAVSSEISPTNSEIQFRSATIDELRLLEDFEKEIAHKKIESEALIYVHRGLCCTSFSLFSCLSRFTYKDNGT